jgi:hypothetical protein
MNSGSTFSAFVELRAELVTWNDDVVDYVRKTDGLLDEEDEDEEVLYLLI